MRYYASSYDGFNDILNREVSYYLSGVYTYDNRYTVSGSLRIDKSNLFGVSDKYRRNPSGHSERTGILKMKNSSIVMPLQL